MMTLLPKPNKDKKNLSVDTATLEAYSKRRDKYNFSSHKELLQKIDLVLNHLKLDLSLPVKEVQAGTGKDQFVSLKELKKLFTEQQTNITDAFIKHHRSDREQRFMAHIIEVFNNYAKTYENNETKDQEILRLKTIIQQLENKKP